MSTESQLWSWLRGVLPYGHWIRVENRIELGTPDVNGCVRGHDVWLELKYSKKVLPATSPFKKRGLSKEQVIWLQERAGVGGNAWIVAGVGRHVYFLLPVYASSFNDMSLRAIQAASSATLERGVRNLVSGPVFDTILKLT